MYFSKKKINLRGLSQKWTLGWEFYYLNRILSQNGIETINSFLSFNSKVYLPSKYSIKNSLYHLFKNEIYFDYFHGHPSISSEFDGIFKYIIKNKKKFTKIRVSNSIIYNLFCENNLQDFCKKIYIGVDNAVFKKVDQLQIVNLKKKLKIPLDSKIIGSFQKDGVGWEQGNIPKMIKGPDILIDTLIKIKKSTKIFVLLLGPSRGYVKNELKKNNISFLHINEKNYFNLHLYYNLLDMYLISSREEGGPKALLESMACQIPVVSTPVGQVIDLVHNEINGLISTNFSANKLAELTIELINNEKLKNKIVLNGKKTALNNDYTKQFLLWNDFFFN